MSLLLSLGAQILHVVLMIAAAPVAAGALDWLEARFAGRCGPPVLLPWRDIVRLSRKTPAETDNGSVILRFAPAAQLGATISAAALVPSFTLGMALSPLADILVMVSLLAVARLAGVLGALDAGAAQPGLAAQQSSAMAVPAEAALVIIAFTLALMGGSFNLDLIVSQARDGLAPAAASAIVPATLLALAVADDGVHTSGLDQVTAGTDLAVSRLACWLRRLVWFNLIGALVLPAGLATAGAGTLDCAVGLACWSLKLAGFIVCLACIRMMLGRIPPRRVPHLAGVAVLLAIIATVMVLANARMA